jgi:hypothetical protein
MTDVARLDVIAHRYGIAAKAAAEAVLEYGRDGARLRPAADAFLLSRIGRAVVDALEADGRGAVEERDRLASAPEWAKRSNWIPTRAEVNTAREALGLPPLGGQ